MSKPPRPIHANHPQGIPHPFKGATLCGLLVRFGGLECAGRPATCKNCLKRQRKDTPPRPSQGQKESVE